MPCNWTFSHLPTSELQSPEYYPWRRYKVIFKYTNIRKCNVFYSKGKYKGIESTPKGSPRDCETVKTSPPTRSSRRGDSSPASHTRKEKAPIYGQKKEMTVRNPPVIFGRCFCSHLPPYPLLFVKWILSDNSKSSWHHHKWQPQMWQIPSNSKRTHLGSAQQRL